MKLLWSALLVLGTLSHATGQSEDELRDNHTTYSLEQEALDRVIYTARNRAAKRFTEAVTLAESTLKRRSDVDGLLALQRVRKALTSDPHLLPSRPSKDNLPELAAYHTTLSHERDQIVFKTQQQKAAQQHAYSTHLKRLSDQSGLSDAQRSLVRNFISAVGGTSLRSPEKLPSKNIRTDISHFSGRAAELIKNCVPMVYEKGRWRDADWKTDLDVEMTPKDNLSIRLRKNAGHKYGKVRFPKPLPPGKSSSLVAKGLRTIELLDITQPDHTLYWLIRSPDKVAEFTTSLNGNRMALHRRISLEPLTRIGSPTSKYDGELKDGRIEGPVPTLYPAFSLSEEREVILVNWQTKDH